MEKYLRISSYVRKPFLIYDFATAPLWISLYMRKIRFSFLSVHLQILENSEKWVSCPSLILSKSCLVQVLSNLTKSCPNPYQVQYCPKSYLNPVEVLSKSCFMSCPSPVQILSISYPNPEHVLPKSCPNHLQILAKYCSSPGQILFKSCPSPVKILSSPGQVLYKS